MAPRFVPQYSALEMFVCRDPDASSCVSGWFRGCLGWSGTYPARLGGLAENGVSYSSALLLAFLNLCVLGVNSKGIKNTVKRNDAALGEGVKMAEE